jgi:hypothetical protein
MPADLGMCLGCSVNKAVTKDGTVPLCSECSRVAKKASRGVKMTDAPKKPKRLTVAR